VNCRYLPAGAGLVEEGRPALGERDGCRGHVDARPGGGRALRQLQLEDRLFAGLALLPLELALGLLGQLGARVLAVLPSDRLMEALGHRGRVRRAVRGSAAGEHGTGGRDDEHSTPRSQTMPNPMRTANRRGYGPAMNGIESRAVFVSILMDKVRADRYPSTSQMEIIEQVIPPQLLPDYLDILLEKVADDRWPSLPMLRRIQRVASSIPTERP
jgi:hypothetical protein